MTMWTRLTLSMALLGLFSAAVQAGEPRFKKHDINPRAIFESAAAIDVDGDGDLDIVCGDTWYAAPDWTPHPTRKVEQVGTYMNDFATLPLDMDGDGDTDFVSVSYFGQDVFWVENPGKTGAEWPVHHIDKPGSSETAVLVDLTGDGKPEILPNVVSHVVFYELVTPGSPPEIKKYDFGADAAAHGVGSGDVNGDGRIDLLTPKGWFEAPADVTTDATWTWHPEWNLDGRAPQKNMCPGIQILAADVDADGLPDLIYGMGHDRGLYWRKQALAADGSRDWGETLVIDPHPTSVHTLLWADLDGDGQANELVTGKRVYAHEQEVGDTEGSLIAYYRFDTNANAWRRFVLFEGEPATNAPADIAKRDAQKDFPPGTAGTGLQVDAVDIDGDGDIDLICPGKSGLYLFENLGPAE